MIQFCIGVEMYAKTTVSDSLLVRAVHTHPHTRLQHLHSISHRATLMHRQSECAVLVHLLIYVLVITTKTAKEIECEKKARGNKIRTSGEKDVKNVCKGAAVVREQTIFY